MKAIVFKSRGVWAYEDRPEPQIKKDDDMIVKVLACSICGTDVHILADPPGVAANDGIILGHEFVGEVLEVEPGVRNFKKGDHLICDNNIPCGVCPACQMGHSNMCKNVQAMGSGTDGVFTSRVSIPEKNAAKIPADLSLDKAIFAEPLNCVMGAMKKANIQNGDTVVVLGGGPIGMYFTTLCKARGAAKVIVSEVSDFRAKHCMSAGADVIVNPKEEDIEEAVLRETDGLGADLVIDAVGVLLPDAIRIVRPAGDIILFGMNSSVQEKITQADLVIKGITVHGNFIGDHTLFQVARLLASDTLDFSHMITHKLPLSKFGEGLEAMRDGSAIEVILYPEE